MAQLTAASPNASAAERRSPGLSFSELDAATLLVGLKGDWKLRAGLPSPAEVGKRLETAARVRRLAFDAARLGAWDSGLLAFLVGVQDLCKTRNIEIDPGALPEGSRRLLKLATAVPERAGARRAADRSDFLTLVGNESLALWRSGGQMLEFLGEALGSFGRMLVGRARFRRSDLMDIIFECGAAALPIVTLIAFLVGLILAFVAQLGTMQVNEEIDALTTFGLSSMEFLVLPRMLALILMMPLLCVYADLMGILGGAVVGLGMLDLGSAEYYIRTSEAVRLNDALAGVVKASVFGVLVAIAGCLRGIQCGRSSAAVGLAATSAVVTGIVFIITTDGIFAVLTNVLGI